MGWYTHQKFVLHFFPGKMSCERWHLEGVISGVPLHFQTTKSHDYYPADGYQHGGITAHGPPDFQKPHPTCDDRFNGWVQCFGHARGSTIDVFGLLQSHGRPDLRTTCANTLHETWRIVKREKSSCDCAHPIIQKTVHRYNMIQLLETYKTHLLGRIGS